MRQYAAKFLLFLTVAGSGACATKSDVDDLRGRLASLRAQQDSLTRLVTALDITLSTAVEEQLALTLTTRGDLRRQLDDMERQLVQIQELLGQSQIVLRNLRGRVEARAETDQELEAGLSAGTDTAGAGRESSSAAARALYNAAIEQFRRGAYNTARGGFQEFLSAHPADELAPDAQYYLAETYREEEDEARAIREYNRVVELYPNSRAAPTALYKAGLLHVEQGNKDTACEYFQRVLAGYPRSDESRLAREQAQRLNCR